MEDKQEKDKYIVKSINENKSFQSAKKGVNTAFNKLDNNKGDKITQFCNWAAAIIVLLGIISGFVSLNVLYNISYSMSFGRSSGVGFFSSLYALCGPIVVGLLIAVIFYALGGIGRIIKLLEEKKD